MHILFVFYLLRRNNSLHLGNEETTTAAPGKYTYLTIDNSQKCLVIFYQLHSVSLYPPNFSYLIECTNDIECTLLSDTCTDGTCLCGDSPACASGQVCESGICVGT